jgi:hypothetical protein
MLSCPFGSYIEVSISASGATGGEARTSYKFDFGAFLDKLNKTLAGIAKLNLGGITKKEADMYYVPMSGTTDRNPISGPLYISPSNGQTGLSVKGEAYFSNHDDESRVFAINNDSVASYKIFKAANAEISTKLTANNIVANNLTASCLTSTNKLSAVNLTANTLTSTSKLSAVNLTANNLSASHLTGSNMSAST